MTNSLPDKKNRFPNCVRMELEITQFNSEKSQLLEQIALILNINWGEHQESIDNGNGTVSFGLKRGELKITLTNGEVPLKNFKLKNEFPIVLEKEVQQEQGSQQQSGVQVVLKNPGITASGQKTEKIAEKIKYDEYQVNIGGTENEPIWVFENKTDKEILQGLLQNTELAIINIKAKPCSLIATFNIKHLNDIFITRAEWLWIKKISNKRKVIIANGIRRLIKNKFDKEPYLSRVKLVHG